MNFKQTVILSSIVCLLLCSINMFSSVGHGIPEIIGALFFSNILVIIYTLVKIKI